MTRSSLSMLALPILGLALIGLYRWGPAESHESATLLLFCNIFLTTTVGLFIAVLAGRSFLVSGRPALLAIHTGMLIWGISAWVAVVGGHVGNYNVTIHNLGLAASGLCHLLGGFYGERMEKHWARNPSSWLAIGTATGFAVVGWIWMATLEGWLPIFFAESTGTTAVRTAVLVVSIGLFVAAATLNALQYRRSGWRFLYWYALGLALIALGAVGLMVQPTHGSWLGWTARVAQYLGGVYMLVGAWLTLKESGAFSLEERLARSEQALRTQADLIAAVNDNTSDLIYMKDQRGRLTYANAATLRALGLAQLPPGAREADYFKVPAEHTPISANDRRVLDTGKIVEAEEVYTGIDGQRRVFLSTKTPLRDASGAIVGVIGVSRDITERRRGEEQLRQAKESAEAANVALEAADRRKDEFLAMLAHELRNPLAPIATGAKVLELIEDPQQQRKVAAMIGRQARHLARLVDDLLDVARVTEGKVTLDFAPVDVVEAVQRAIEQVRPLFDEKRHELRLSVSAPGTLVVRADATRLAQVICNLLNNAAKYTDPGGHIELSARDERDDVVISVRDNGAGLSAQLLPRVFDLFVQGEQHLARAQGGMGLGLALVKKLVELHHGTVSAESAGEGRGGTFTIRLPRLLQAPQVPETPTPAVACPPRRILVVDDNVDSAHSIGMLLELSGHTLAYAFDGLHALSAAAQFQPDVVLLDLGLPGMDGYAVAARLRSDPATSRADLIALTGYGQQEDKERTRAAGFDHHLVKPVDQAQLDALLARLPRDKVSMQF
jgi:PAS domain S-box-containing protein